MSRVWRYIRKLPYIMSVGPQGVVIRWWKWDPPRVRLRPIQGFPVEHLHSDRVMGKFMTRLKCRHFCGRERMWVVRKNKWKGKMQ